ncbi:MAG: AAA-like domain-containing protein, partial [Cyanobacteriota bacterium]|nr:AAA-like domain-containing protein [Cyanobacteriota bacterium]
IDGAIVISLDDVEIIFQYPEIGSKFLLLLRTWHEKAKYGNNQSRLWKKLRLVVAYSTEVYMPSMINRSPFHVGLSVELPDFTREQIQDLVLYYGFNWTIDRIKQLTGLIKGHPYLIQKTLYLIWQQNFTLEELLVDPGRQAVIYEEHLRYKLSNLRQYPELYTAFIQVINSPISVELEWMQALQLQAMGLVYLRGNCVLPSCDLYRQYFSLLETHKCEFHAFA